MRMLRRAALTAGFVLAVLAGVFFALGGLQIVRILRGPTLPETAAPPTAMSDLAYLRDSVLANDHGGTPQEYARFKAILDQSKAASADDVTLAASRAMAVFQNGHSTVDTPMMRRIPLRLHWTADALIVVKAKPEYARLLGRRITAIGGLAPEQLLSKMRLLAGGGTPGWTRYRSEYFLTAPAALRALGAAIDDGGGIRLETLDREGQTEQLAMKPESAILPADSFRQWRDQLPGDVHFKTQGWVTLLKSGQHAPLYQQDPEHSFLLRDVASHDAVYVRMNGSVNDKDETAAAFVQRVQAAIRRDNRRNTIMDFRYNWGGGFELSLPLAKTVAANSPPNGRIYLIVGPNTFSAGLISASQLKYYGGNRVTVVGEEPGDALRFRAEGFDIELPATGVGVYVPTAWDDVATDCGLFDDCWPPQKFMLKGVGTLHPTIRIANTWASYRDGIDLVVDAIFADIDSRKRK